MLGGAGADSDQRGAEVEKPVLTANRELASTGNYTFNIFTVWGDFFYQLILFTPSFFGQELGIFQRSGILEPATPVGFFR